MINNYMAAYDTNDLHEIGSLLDKVNKQKIATPQDISNQVRRYVNVQEKEKNNKVVVEALDSVGKEDGDIDYYKKDLEYIVEPHYKLHAVDIDEDRGEIDIEFTYNKTKDTYAISYNHHTGNMDVSIASGNDSGSKYEDVPEDDFRKSDYHDTVYRALELEIDNLSRFFNEEPDDRDYEDDERLGRMGYGKDQAN